VKNAIKNLMLCLTTISTKADTLHQLVSSRCPCSMRLMTSRNTGITSTPHLNIILIITENVIDDVVDDIIFVSFLNVVIIACSAKISTSCVGIMSPSTQSIFSVSSSTVHPHPLGDGNSNLATSPRVHACIWMLGSLHEGHVYAVSLCMVVTNWGQCHLIVRTACSVAALYCTSTETWYFEPCWCPRCCQVNTLNRHNAPV